MKEAELTTAVLLYAIRCLAEGPDGRLWVGADDGLNSIDPADGAVERVDLRPGRGGQPGVLGGDPGAGRSAPDDAGLECGLRTGGLGGGSRR